MSEGLKPPSLSGRLEPYAESLLLQLGMEMTRCLKDAREAAPGEAAALREAEIRNAVRLGKLSANIMLAMAKLSGRSRHHIHVTRGPEGQEADAADRLMEFWERSNAREVDYDLPAGEQARIAMALEEEKFVITAEEMNSPDTGRLRERLAQYKEERSERRHLLLHEADRHRLTEGELKSLERDEFAERLQVYAIERVRRAEAEAPGDADKVGPGDPPRKLEVRMGGVRGDG